MTDTDPEGETENGDGDGSPLAPRKATDQCIISGTATRSRLRVPVLL